jgi:hypothetical protein
MSNFLDDLLKYLKETPKEKVHQDWAKSEALDNIGPTFEEFLANTHYYHVTSQDPVKQALTSVNKDLSPKYPSGFLFLRQQPIPYAESRV